MEFGEFRFCTMASNQYQNVQSKSNSSNKVAVSDNFISVQKFKNYTVNNNGYLTILENMNSE